MPVPSRNGEPNCTGRVQTGTRKSRCNTRRSTSNESQAEPDQQRPKMASVQYLLPRIQTGADRKVPVNSGCGYQFLDHGMEK